MFCAARGPIGRRRRLLRLILPTPPFWPPVAVLQERRLSAIRQAVSSQARLAAAAETGDNANQEEEMFRSVTVLLLFTGIATAADTWNVRIEVMFQPTPQARLQSQSWSRVFNQMGRTARFRSGFSGEKTRLQNSGVGRRKSVLAVGLLNRDGSLSFTGKKFRLDEPVPLKEWLGRLAQHGAKGPASESATWGLSEDEFTTVLQLLGRRVKQPIRLNSPVTVIDSLQLSSRFRVVFEDAARRQITSIPGPDESTSAYAGLTTGSVLAACLAKYGLGFRPESDGKGDFVLRVVKGGETDNLFPVGWRSTKPIMHVLPRLGTPVDVDLENRPLDLLARQIGDELRIPHFFADYALRVAGKQPRKLLYSRPPSRITVQQLMDSVSTKHQIGISPRTDEAGNVFLWITSRDEYNAFRKRFADAVPPPN